MFVSLLLLLTFFSSRTPTGTSLDPSGSRFMEQASSKQHLCLNMTICINMADKTSPVILASLLLKNLNSFDEICNLGCHVAWQSLKKWLCITYSYWSNLVSASLGWEKKKLFAHDWRVLNYNGGKMLKIQDFFFVLAAKCDTHSGK